jgi:hypothetical protein
MGMHWSARINEAGSQHRGVAIILFSLVLGRLLGNYSAAIAWRLGSDDTDTGFEVWAISAVAGLTLVGIGFPAANLLNDARPMDGGVELQALGGRPGRHGGGHARWPSAL